MHVLGRGFAPIDGSNGTPIAGSGVYRVTLVDTDAQGQSVEVNVPFDVVSDTELTLHPPPHAPTFQVDSQGNIVDGVSWLPLKFYAWGTQVISNPNVYALVYAHPPVISRMDAEPDPNGEPASGIAVASSAGGTKLTVESIWLDLSHVNEALVDGAR